MKSETLDELDKAGVEAIEQAKVWATDVVEFMKEQVPELIEEVLLMARIQHTLWVVFGLVLLASCVACVWKVRTRIATFDWTSSSLDWDMCRTMPYGVAAVACGVAGLANTLGNINICLKVWFAPRVYLLEYFSDLY